MNEYCPLNFNEGRTCVMIQVLTRGWELRSPLLQPIFSETEKNSIFISNDLTSFHLWESLFWLLKRNQHYQNIWTSSSMSASSPRRIFLYLFLWDITILGQPCPDLKLFTSRDFRRPARALWAVSHIYHCVCTTIQLVLGLGWVTSPFTNQKKPNNHPKGDSLLLMATR